MDWTGNSRSIVGCLGVSNHSAEDRQVHDFYATDPIDAEWLICFETYYAQFCEQVDQHVLELIKELNPNFPIGQKQLSLFEL